MVSDLESDDENLVAKLWSILFPYWPLFLVLILISVAAAWIYLQYQVPLFEASASILVKNDKKGADDPKIPESLDYLSSKKILENEVEIIKSKNLMTDVVYKLNLYAPVYQENKLKSLLVSSTSPILIQAKDPDAIKGSEKIHFIADEKNNKIFFGGRSYLINQWVKTKMGTLKFVLNPTFQRSNNVYYFSLINPKNVASTLLERLDVSPQGKLSSIIVLKIKDESPIRAENILSTLIENYKEVSIREKNNLAINTLIFLEARLKTVRKDLDSIERKIQQYKSDESAVNISRQGEIYLQNVSLNDQELSNINIQLSVLNQVETTFLRDKDKFDIVIPSMLGINDPTLSTLVSQLYNLQLEFEKLKNTTAENNPLLVSITDRIKKIRINILENISSQKASLESTRKDLSSTNSNYSNVIHGMPQKEKDLLEISREQNIKTNIYNFLLQKHEETALSNSKTETDILVVNTADASPGPISPKKTIVYLAFVVSSLMIGGAAIYAKDTFNSTVLFRDEIESATSFRVIGEIAYDKSKSQMLIDTNKLGLVVEQFRKLRTSFPYLGINVTTKKKILVTSTLPGEGKSFIAMNLALTLAAEGKKVIILEADLRKPSLSKKLNLVEKDGISNYLMGQIQLDRIIKQTEYKNLSLAPAGPFQANPSALFLSGRLEILLNKLEGLFDYIIIDSAPTALLSDAYILSPLCDATLYVVRHNYTPKSILKRLIKNNEINRLENIAIVFNGVQKRGLANNDYGYGYGYDSEYAYSQNQKNNAKSFS